MKKLIFILFAFLAITATAQTTPSYPTVKLTKPATGAGTDDVLTIGVSKTVNKVTKASLLSGLATTTYVDAADATKAPIASPTFTGTVSGITKAMVGLGNVDNTTDLAKPISIATQTALDTKQVTLASGTSIKTINGNSLLGGGDLVIGASSSEQMLYNTTHYPLLNQVEYQKIFNSGVLTVEAGKTYLFRLEVTLYQFSSYGRVVSFSMLGTANVSNIHLNMTSVLNANTPGTVLDYPVFPDPFYFTNGQMGWSGTAHIKGSFKASVSGTLIPAFKFDALPGPSLQACAGSYFILKKLD